MLQYLTLFLLSILPIIELRGGIPLGMQYGLPTFLIFILCVLGSLLGGILVLIILYYFEKIIDKGPFFKRFKEKILEHTRKKHSQKFQKLKEGLIIVLAAIPIPILGGSYTAALASYVFGVKKTTSILFIFLGLCIQALIILGPLKLLK